MRADNEFLHALAIKLSLIAEACIDVETQEELTDLVEATLEQIIVQSKE